MRHGSNCPPPPPNFNRNRCFLAISTEAFWQFVEKFVFFTVKFCSKCVTHNGGINGIVGVKISKFSWVPQAPGPNCKQYFLTSQQFPHPYASDTHRGCREVVLHP